MKEKPLQVWLQSKSQPSLAWKRCSRNRGIVFVSHFSFFFLSKAEQNKEPAEEQLTCVPLEQTKIKKQSGKKALVNSRKDYKSLGTISLNIQPSPNSRKFRKSLKHNLAKARKADQAYSYTASQIGHCWRQPAGLEGILVWPRAAFPTLALRITG